MKIKNLKMLTIVSLTLFVGFVGYALVYTQIIPYMESLGMNAQSRGLVLTSSAIIAIVVQLFTGYLSDRYQMIKGITIIVHLMFGFFSFLGYTRWINQSTSLYFVLIMLAVSLFRVVSNLIESWIYEINEETQKHFGILRLFGSLGWAIGAYLVSILVNQGGYHVIGKVVGLLMILDVTLMVLMPAPPKSLTALSINTKDIQKLFKNKQYVLMLIIFFWLFMINNLSGLTVIDRLLELKATSSDISQFWSLQAISEMVLMVGGGFFIAKFGGKKILIFVSCIIALRFVLYGLADSSQQIIIISLLQGIIFPFLLLVQKRMVARHTPIELRSSGHMVMTAVTSNIPIIITPVLSGFLIQNFAISQILVFAGLSCIIPLFLSFMAID